MTKAELQELRALLRTQAEIEAARPASSLRERLARPFRRAAAPAAPPVRVEMAPAAAISSAMLAPVVLEADELVLAAPAPRRACFGMAGDEARQTEARQAEAPAVEPRALVDAAEALRPAPLSATDVFLSRINRPVAPVAASASAQAEPIGADELLELQDLLAERLPGLLAQLDGALDRAPTPAPVVEAAVPEPTCDIVPMEPTPRLRPRLKLYAVPTGPDMLADLHASLAAEQAALDDALQGFAPAEPPLYAKAA